MAEIFPNLNSGDFPKSKWRRLLKSKWLAFHKKKQGMENSAKTKYVNKAFLKKNKTLKSEFSG